MVCSLPLDVLTVVVDALPGHSRLDDSGVKTLVACSRVNHLFRESILRPSLWHCAYRLRYTVFDPPAENARILQFADDWRLRYYARRDIDKQALVLLEDLVCDPVKAPEVARALVHFQLDIWDLLKQQTDLPLPPYFRNVPSKDPFEPQALPKRYWAKRVTHVVPSIAALKLWDSLRQDPNAVSFEDTFNAMSSFFGVPPYVLTQQLSTLADECRFVLRSEEFILDPSNPNYDVKGVCHRIHSWMYSKGFKGAQGRHFHCLMNNFPHSYIDPQSHPNGTIQLSLTHIFIAISRRLGVEASPTNFPRNVLAHIRSPMDEEDDFFVDLYNPDKPILNLRQDIVPKVMSLGIHPSDIFQHIQPVPPHRVLVRASQNILAALQFDNSLTGLNIELVRPARFVSTFIILLFTSSPDVAARLRDFMYDIVEQTCLLSDTLLPLLQGSPQYSLIEDLCNDLSDTDSTSLANISKRSAQLTPIEFFVGAIFRHKRNNYLGCIISWHPVCRAPEDWIHQMGVAQLLRGRNQPFYDVLSGDGSRRYVAEENIQIHPVKRGEVLALYEAHASFGKYFQDIEHGAEDGREGFARLIPSPEHQYFYPEDMQAGNEWMGLHLDS